MTLSKSTLHHYLELRVAMPLKILCLLQLTFYHMRLTHFINAVNVAWGYILSHMRIYNMEFYSSL